MARKTYYVMVQVGARKVSELGEDGNTVNGYELLIVEPDHMHIVPLSPEIRDQLVKQLMGGVEIASALPVRMDDA